MPTYIYVSNNTKFVLREVALLDIFSMSKQFLYFVHKINLRCDILEKVNLRVYFEKKILRMTDY